MSLGPEGLARGGPDIAAILAKLEHYCRATGVPAHLLDLEGPVLGAFDPSGARVPSEALATSGLCPACGIEGAEEEFRAQVYVAYQAERFGGACIQLCPHSLLFWAAPLVSDGAMALALIGGPVMVVDPKRASSLAELLRDVATALSRPSPLESRREREEQQSRIADIIRDMKAQGSVQDASPPYPIEKERELLLAISRGDKPESQRLLNEILGFIFFSSGQEASIVKARVLELVVLLSRAALEGGADAEQIFGLNFTYLGQLSGMRSVDDIASWLSKIMLRFTDLVFRLKDVKHADAMTKAIKYINGHYTEEITLDDVAGTVFLSPSYFSKLFSEEMGCHFTAYLNKLRIEKSKLLLTGSAIPLVDVAGLVGYEDQSYFTKVFKRITGLSPGKYRESGGRGNANSQ